MKTIIITVLIGIALVFLASGCDNVTGVSETQKDETNPTIEVLERGGIIRVFEYTSLEYKTQRGGLLFINTPSGIISYSTDDIRQFFTSETNQFISITTLGEGTASYPYTSINYTDRNILIINNLNNQITYGIDSYTDYNTYEQNK